jgi:hypothetical protein
METKTITKGDWQAMDIVTLPTATRGAVRLDHVGRRWEWIASGKRVTVRRVVVVVR